MLEDLGYDRRYVLEHLRQLPLDPFRISYAYTNFGFTAAAEAVAVERRKVVGGPQRRGAVSPLGMTSTSSRFADYEARPNSAVGHIHVDGNYEPLYVRDPDPEAPAGGASSSVNDMTHWLAMVLANGSYDGQQIVDPKALLPAVTPQIVSSPATEPAMRSGFYGFGFNVGTDVGGADGAQPFRRLRTGRRDELRDPAVRRRGDRRADQRHPAGVPEALTAAVRRPGAVRRGS